MLDDELARGVVPVSHTPSSPAPSPRPENRIERAAKLARRLAALPAGRYEVIVTVDEHGLRDWSVRSYGKVEQ